MKLYSTVFQEGCDEQVIEKSKFIAYVSPASSKEDADVFIAKIKKKHRDATHNVPAMVIGDNFQIQWASDDGEPQGTSGAPIVQMLVQLGITNVVIVVTRYFGGIKLGTGGLVRAYTNSAKKGLGAAGICDVEESCVLSFIFEYTFLARLQNMESEQLFQILDLKYTDVVEASLCCKTDQREQVIKTVVNMTSGKGILKEERVELIRKKREIIF